MKYLRFLILTISGLGLSFGVDGQDFKQYLDEARENLDNGQYELCINICKDALPLIQDKFGANDTIYYIKQLDILAHAYGFSYQYDHAEQIHKQIIKIYETIHSTQGANYAIALNTFAAFYNQAARFEQAENLIKRAILIIEIKLGENNILMASFYNHLALTYDNMGNYVDSEQLYLKALKILLSIGLESDLYYASTLNSLAIVYLTTGRFKESEVLFRQALDICKREVGVNHPFYSIYLTGLAGSLQKLGFYKEAEDVFYNAIYICKNQPNINLINYTKLLIKLADLLRIEGNFERIEQVLKEAIEVSKISTGERHPVYAKVIESLGLHYQLLNKYGMADSLYKIAANIYQSTLGNNHLDYAWLLDKQAKLSIDMLDFHKSILLMKKAFSIYSFQIINNTRFLSAIEKEQFINTFIFCMDIYQSINKQFNQKKIIVADFAYNIELNRKGILLKSSLEMIKRILGSKDELILKDYYNLSYLRKIIENIKVQYTEKSSENLELLEERANILEKTLLSRSEDYGNAKKENEMTWINVKNNLKSVEAAIEFSSFHYFNGKVSTDSILYCAIVLKSDDTIPHIVYLCEETQLKKAIPSSLGSALKDINSAYRSSSLYNLIWQPIDSLLTGTETIYFAPSGLLNSVSLAAITCPDNKTLMEEYNLVQLSSTRTLALPEEPTEIKDAVVYGGINYDTDTLSMLAKANKYREKEEERLAYNRSATWNNRSGFRYLEGTEKEAEQITGKLNKKGITTQTYTGDDAPEESFAALSGHDSPSVIHISTHGFYYPDTISDENRKQMDLSGSGELRFRYSDDPLLRSGLLMSGANRAWSGLPIPSGVEDGILTAKEVSNMNLMNTGLVVLSACQTGQGDVKGSEGVEGLQRGFKMAGVRYLIMSLWEIPDRETTEFMEDFYDHWVGGLEIREAFRNTQLKMKNKYRDEPFKWAGFVLME